MPFLRIETNVDLDAFEQVAILEEMSSETSRTLNKSEDYVMVSVRPNASMVFGGNDLPTAILELDSIGLTSEQAKALSQVYAALIAKHCKVDSKRLYIKFQDIDRPMWGWDGSTFG